MQVWLSGNILCFKEQGKKCAIYVPMCFMPLLGAPDLLRADNVPGFCQKSPKCQIGISEPSVTSEGHSWRFSDSSFLKGEKKFRCADLGLEHRIGA